MAAARAGAECLQVARQGPTLAKACRRTAHKLVRAAPQGQGLEGEPDRGRAALAVSTMSVYKPCRDDGGRRILVTRYYPRGVRRSHFDDWIRALAPSRELLKGYKEGSIGWSDFTVSFLAQMRGSSEAQSALRDLRDAAVDGGVTLLCYEPDGDPCHRHIVRRLVEEPRLVFARTLEPDCTDYHKGFPVASLVSD